MEVRVTFALLIVPPPHTHHSHREQVNVDPLSAVSTLSETSEKDLGASVHSSDHMKMSICIGLSCFLSCFCNSHSISFGSSK